MVLAFRQMLSIFKAKRQNMKAIATLLIVFSSFLLFGQSTSKIQVQSFQLDNGLTILLNEDPNATKVFGAVAVNAGGKNDPADATGIAHYLEHLLFKGTTEMGTINYEKEKPHLDSIKLLYDRLAASTSSTHSAYIQSQINEHAVAASKYSLPNEFDKLLKSIGSTGVNAFTNNDMTFYHNSFPANQILKWLDIYSHRFQNPVFRSFQSELEVVYEEKNRAMDDFQRRIFERLNAELYKDHPYGKQTVLGSVEHLKKPSLKKMYEFYEKYYVANNMALILCGNFDSQEIIPVINEKFGTWRMGTVEQPSSYQAQPINGKEVVKARITPVKVGMLGFKTVPYNHPDRVALNVLDYLLFNESETGLLNKLQLARKLLYTGAFADIYNEAGTGVIFFVPKIFGQSLGNAEKLVLAEIKKLHKGQFSDNFLNATKAEIINNFHAQLENLSQRGRAIGAVFNQGKTWEDHLKYPQQVDAISKDDIIRVAKKYYGDNFLALYSRMGFPKKTKLSKPGFKAVQPDQSKSSTYAKQYDNIKEIKSPEQFLNFKKDVSRATINDSHQLFVTPNPMNDIFSMSINYQIGYQKLKDLGVVDEIINYSGTSIQSLNELKEAFAQIGCSYSFSCGRNAFVVTLRGQERNLAKAVNLLNNIITNPAPTEESFKLTMDQYKTERRLEQKTPSQMGMLLRNYITFGDQSYYLNRPSVKNIKNLTIEKTKTLFKEALSYQSSIHFTGNSPINTVKNLLEESYTLPASDKKEAPSYRPVKVPNKPKIYFVHDKKAVQSQVYFMVSGEPYSQENRVPKLAFNTYFGDGFSGLVLQEIREYRSLAYSAWGTYLSPDLTPGKRGWLWAYIGCQSDKTTDAISVMNNLLTDLPAKEDRLPTIQSSLIFKARSAYPTFRAISSSIENYEKIGFENDPNKMDIQKFENLSFEDIQKFYQTQIKNKPITIGIYGNKKRIDMDALKKYGEVIETGKKEIAVF